MNEITGQNNLLSLPVRDSMTSDQYLLKTGRLHRIDGAYLEGSHARMVMCTYEDRPLAINEPGPFDDDDDDVLEPLTFSDVALLLGMVVAAWVLVIAMFALAYWVTT